MRTRFGYVISGLGGAVAMLALLLTMQMEQATARTGGDSNVVNRTLKGDRLPSPPDIRLQTREPSSLAPTEQLPDGCEAAISTINRTPLATLPSRCIS
jgi:hypothetical protein